VLSDFLENLEEWKRSWRESLTLEQERRLYLVVAQALEAAGKASEAQRFLLRYLASFKDTDNLGGCFLSPSSMPNRTACGSRT
jgi:hypothetical protein